MSVSFKEEFHCRNFLFHHTQPYKFVRSQWPIPHPFYISWRLFWAGWHFAWIVYSIKITTAQYAGEGVKWLIYLTNLSYILLTVQSILHATVVVWYTCAKDKGSRDSIQERIPWYLQIVWLLTSVCFDTAIAVTVLYWIVVFTKLDVITVIVHGVNSVYVLSDICFIATPVRLLHIVYSIVYGAAYIVFTVIYYAAKGTGLSSEPSIYKALDWSTPGRAAVISLGALLGGLLIIHHVQFGLYALRLYIMNRCRCCKSCSEDDDDTYRCCLNRVDSGSQEMAERA